MNYYLDLMLQELLSAGYRRRTVEAYMASVKAYLSYTGEEFVFDVENRVKMFLAYKRAENCAPKTLHVYLSALKFLYNQVLRIPQKIEIKFPKTRRRFPAVLQRAEIRLLMSCLSNFKHRLMIGIAYGSGLRVSEVVNLRKGDFDFHKRLLHIRNGKGGKDRYSIIPSAIVEDLNEFCWAKDEKDYVFVGREGSKLHSRSAQEVFRAAMKMAGIKKKATFHSLRHSFATHLVQDGVSLAYVQRLLGHRSVKTTEIYLHLAQSENLAQIESPLKFL